MNWEKLIFMLILSIIFSLLVASGYLIFNAIYMLRTDYAAGEFLKKMEEQDKRFTQLESAVFGSPLDKIIEREGK